MNAGDQILSEYKFNDNTLDLTHTASNPSDYQISKTTSQVKKILILDNNNTNDCSIDNEYSVDQSDRNIYNQLTQNSNN